MTLFRSIRFQSYDVESQIRKANKRDSNFRCCILCCCVTSVSGLDRLFIEQPRQQDDIYPSRSLAKIIRRIYLLHIESTWSNSRSCTRPTTVVRCPPSRCSTTRRQPQPLHHLLKFRAREMMPEREKCIAMTWESKARARHRLESSLSESRDSDGDGVSLVVDGSGPM